MKGLGIIAVIALVWFLLKSRATAAPASSVNTDTPAPDPSPTRVTETPLIGTAGSGNNALDNFGQAIAQFERANPAYNNPGAIENAQGKFVTYADQGDGWDALNGLITRRAQQNPNWNFYDFFQGYLGQQQGGPAVTDQGNSNNYAEYVASYLGVDPTTPVSSVLQGG